MALQTHGAYRLAQLHCTLRIAGTSTMNMMMVIMSAVMMVVVGVTITVVVTAMVLEVIVAVVPVAMWMLVSRVVQEMVMTHSSSNWMQQKEMRSGR